MIINWLRVETDWKVASGGAKSMEKPPQALTDGLLLVPDFKVGFSIQPCANLRSLAQNGVPGGVWGLEGRQNVI